MKIENNFWFLPKIGYQTSFLSQKTKNCFWKQKTEEKNSYQTYPYFFTMWTLLSKSNINIFFFIHKSQQIMPIMIKKKAKSQIILFNFA